MNHNNLLNPLGVSTMMKRIRSTFAVCALGAATLGVLGTACVEPAPDINRVAPNALKKAMFTGEWYMRGTVVDKQAHSPFPVIGYADELERVKWEITPGLLLAVRSYDKTPGSDPSDPGQQTIIAAFTIQSHFDIKRDYNPVNGVESNVIVENDTDRPWHEREYMRVDWSRNVAPSYTMNQYLSVFSPGIVSHNTDNDPTYPWRMRVECANEDQPDTCNYLETTIDAIVEPDPYACNFLDGLSPCNGASVKVKMSFKKVDPANDYVALDYPDFVPIKFGTNVDPNDDDKVILSSDGQQARICTEEEVDHEGMGRITVRRSGGPGSQWRACNPNTDVIEEDCTTIDTKCADLQELWVSDSPGGYELCDVTIHDPDDCFQWTVPVFSKFAFFRTDRYVLDRENGTTFQGRERLINRYNIWKKSRNDDGTIIPISQREPKPVVFYTNVYYPPELFEAAQEIADDYDVALRNTVAATKGISPADVGRMFEIRPNDCNPDNVKKYAQAHDLEGRLSENGIMEVQSGNVENACAVLEFYSKKDHIDPVFTWQQTGDVRLSFMNWTKKLELAGPLGVAQWAADPVTGETISGSANVFGDDLDIYANWGADIVDLINGKISQDDVINGTQVREHIEAVHSRWSKSISPEQVNKFQQLVDNRTAGMPDAQYFKEIPLTAMNYNLDLLADTGFEEENLVTADMVRLFGGKEAIEALQNGGPIPEEIMNKARPSSWARSVPPAAALDNKAFDDEARGAPLGNVQVASLAERARARQEFFDRQSMCFLKEQVEPAVADLAATLTDKSREDVVKVVRASIMRAVMAHEVGHVMGLRHNFEGSSDALNFFPQYWDVDTGDDRMAATDRKSELAYSSIMDYHQRFNSDFAGIGLYDKAALKFGYGEMMEVFDEREEAFVPRGWFDIAYLFAASDLPYLLGGEGNEDKIDTLYDTVYDQVLNGNNGVILDIKTASGIEKNASNLYKRRDVPFAQFKRTEVLRTFGQTNDDGAPNPFPVPYSYCSDSYAWGGNLTCNRYDMGVSSEEIVKNAGQMYEFYYPFQAFRGDRVENWDYGWNPNSYITRLYDRTYQPMLNAFRYFYYFRRSTANIWPGIKDWSTASLIGMNFFARVLQTPEPGKYCLVGDMYVPEGETTSTNCTANSFSIGLADGRLYSSHYTDELDFHYKNVGHFYDKALAIQAMTDTNAFFFRDFSNLVNRGSFSIGYYRVFEQEMLRLFGGLIMGDRTKFAAKVSTTGGNATIDYAPLVDLDGTAAEAPTGTKIAPAASHNLKLWAMFYGMANLSSTLDQTLDFAKRTRVTLAGSRSDPTIDPTVIDPSRIEEFVDPQSQLVYRAAQTDLADTSIGFMLLQDANAFLPTYEAKKDALDTALQGTDANAIATAQTEYDLARIQLNDKVQVIDWMRYLGDILEYGG